MSRSVGLTVENNFTKGFLTEFSGLNFPENACLDVENCTLTETGEVYRRRSIDREYAYVMNSVGYASGDAISSYLWTGAGILGSISFAIFQIGQVLHLWQPGISGSSVSAHERFTINLNTYKVAGAPSTATERCSFASGNGKLYVAHGFCTPFSVEYNQTTDSISVTTLTIKIRDFGIQDDGLAIDAEPTTLSNAHKYNLLNQGWPTAKITECFSESGRYPSKAMLFWFYRNASNGSTEYELSNRYKYAVAAGSLAPRGAIILDAFNQQRSAASGVSGIPDVTSSYNRPSAVAFMNSRVFYTGVKSAGFSSNIYFSSIMRATSSDLLFYQRSDPTSEIANELYANDGGVITIPEADSIIALISAKSYLIVFATNGVWAVSGSEGIGFTATDYMVQKISEVPAVSPQSIISVDNTPIWWNYDGIYAISVNLEKLSASSLTLQSIQTFYRSIPNVCKQNVYPSFNRLTSEITWLYSSDSANPQLYDKALVMKTTTQAFYKHSITSGYANVIGALVLNSPAASTASVPITTTGGISITTTTDASVFVDETVSGDFQSIYTIFLTRIGTQTTFSAYTDSSSIDWITIGNSTPFDSYLRTAYRVRGDSLRKFQTNFIEVVSRQVTDSSCFMRGVWDYAIDEAANRYSPRQQAIVERSHQSVTSRRLRVRGQGKVLNLEFYSDAHKPFHLIGWVTQDIVNDKV